MRWQSLLWGCADKPWGVNQVVHPSVCRDTGNGLFKWEHSLGRAFVDSLWGAADFLFLRWGLAFKSWQNIVCKMDRNPLQMVVGHFPLSWPSLCRGRHRAAPLCTQCLLETVPRCQNCCYPHEKCNSLNSGWSQKVWKFGWNNYQRMLIIFLWTFYKVTLLLWVSKMYSLQLK